VGATVSRGGGVIPKSVTGCIGITIIMSNKNVVKMEKEIS